MGFGGLFACGRLGRGLRNRYDIGSGAMREPAASVRPYFERSWVAHERIRKCEEVVILITVFQMGHMPS
jgi:hypothetical protein